MSRFRRVSNGTSGAQNPARSAAWLNAVSQSAEHFLQQVANGQVTGGQAGAHGMVNPLRVRNLVGGDLVRGEVVQLGESLLSPFDPRNPWFEGNAYDETVERPIAIVVAATELGEIVEAAVTGVCVARVNVTNTSHRFAVPSDGLSVLESAESGELEILSEVGSTGEQELHVRFAAVGGSSLQPGEATTTITAASDWSTPGSGMVQFKKPDGTNDGSPVEVANIGLDSFANKSIVWCDRSFSPPLIVSVFCTPAT